MEGKKSFLLLEGTWRAHLTAERLQMVETLEARGYVGSVWISWYEPRTVQFAWNAHGGKHHVSELHAHRGSNWVNAFDQATLHVLGNSASGRKE